MRLLQDDGDFLVRETTRNDEKQIVLSVMWGSPKHFIVQLSAEGQFRFEGPAFNTIQELIIHQFQSGASVTSRSGAVLRNPVTREKWELNNDDVELVEKIGRGNFGDVYKARLKQNNLSVAVKTCKVTLPDEQKKKFLQEGRILKQYEHPNIVRFIGICVQKQPIMIVMELVSGGSLLNYLRTSSDKLATKALLGNTYYSTIPTDLTSPCQECAKMLLAGCNTWSLRTAYTETWQQGTVWWGRRMLLRFQILGCQGKSGFRVTG